MGTRTGSDYLYGVRYDALGTRRRETQETRDADLGALDAPHYIAAGSQVDMRGFGLSVRATSRNGTRLAIPLSELNAKEGAIHA